MLRFQPVKYCFLITAAVLLILHFGIGWSFWWVILCIITFMSVCAFGAFALDQQFFLPVRSIGAKRSRAIAITFDDGPIAGKTNQILDILQQHGVPATFFCIGSKARMEAETLKRIDQQGHLIGNHSFWHRNTFGFLSQKTIEKELADTDNIIHSITGKTPRFFRPPFGVSNPMISKAVMAGQYTVVGWSVRSFDTVIKDPTRLLARVTRSIGSGDIILFHDYADCTLEILPEFLAHVKEQGLKIVRLDLLLNEEGYR